MTVVNKSTMKTEAIYSEDGKCRFLLHKEWQRSKKRSAIIMKSPSDAGELILDMTTMYVINNIVNLGYGSVDILNLYPEISTAGLKELGRDKDIMKLNDEHIVKAAENADVIILAWGTGCQTSKKVQERIDAVKALIRGSKAEIKQIAAPNGRIGFHPLAAEIRSHWTLK